MADPLSLAEQLMHFIMHSPHEVAAREKKEKERARKQTEIAREKNRERMRKLRATRKLLWGKK